MKQSKGTKVCQPFPPKNRFRHLPPNSGGSILVAVWSLSCSVLVFSYSSTLLASLVVEDYTRPIDSLEELLYNVRENGEQAFVVNGSLLLESMRYSGRPVVRELFNIIYERGYLLDWSGEYSTKTKNFTFCLSPPPQQNCCSYWMHDTFDQRSQSKMHKMQEKLVFVLLLYFFLMTGSTPIHELVKFDWTGAIVISVHLFEDMIKPYYDTGEVT